MAAARDASLVCLKTRGSRRNRYEFLSKSDKNHPFDAARQETPPHVVEEPILKHWEGKAILIPSELVVPQRTIMLKKQRGSIVARRMSFGSKSCE